MALTKVDISLMDNATGFTIVTKIVTVAASKLVTDGVSQDTLILTEGYTYKFDTSHATMSGHTFSFATAADAAGSTQYTTGVTTSGTPGSANAYTQIVVAQSAPVLYYYCANHASMGGTTSTPAAVIANKLLAYDGSGNLPVVDGSQLTGVPGATKSASDPVITTNPSGGLGTQWNNTTSGEVYICTDATAGANVWKNVGAGTGNVQPWGFQGTAYGYHFGSNDNDNGSLQKYSFTSDGNATDLGTVTVARNTWVGFTAETHGYLAGGYSAGNVIDRVEYASDSSMSDVGDMITNRRSSGGSNNATYGYIHGGYRASPAATVDVIERFQMAASASGADVGDLTVARNYPGGNSDIGNNYGYCTGGYGPGPGGFSNVIDRYQMVASVTSADVGDMSNGSPSHANQSTETHGYQAGFGEAGQANHIRKFAFGSSATGTDVGDLTVARFDTCGTSSTTYGYSAGGIWPDAINVTIDKFSFAADANATDVGDLATGGGRYNGPTGAQV